MKRHLSANDYYSEHENVTGYWNGKAAELLGIEGESVTSEAFEALRTNRHPLTGEKLRPRAGTVAFHDIVVSSPKSISIAAMVGGDERLIEAFGEVVERAFKKLEAHAGVRDRKGDAYNTENIITTGNGIAAVYHHDTSRLLEPQLHAHLVFSNHTWSQSDGKWMALQPKRMMEESSTSIRQSFYRDMAGECERLGYEVEWKNGAPRLTGITPDIENAFSVRSQQKKAFTQRYTELFKEEPSKKRIEQFIKETKKPAMKRFVSEYEQAFGRRPSDALMTSFVKDWRSDKMAHSSSDNVLAGQLKGLNVVEAEQIHQTVAEARVRETMRHSEGDKVQAVKIKAESEKTERNRVKPTYRPETMRQSPKVEKNGSQAITRTEALRRLRRGAAISRALMGNPAGLIAYSLRQAARKREQ